MSQSALDPGTAMGTVRVVGALASRALRVQFRRAQFLIPAFLLPLVLLVVIASGTSSAKALPGFPTTGAYVGFVVGGTLMQGALLAGITAGIALAVDIEGGFFDRLLSAPIQRVSIVLGRVTASAGLGVVQAVVFLGVAWVFGARYEGGITGVVVRDPADGAGGRWDGGAGSVDRAAHRLALAAAEPLPDRLRPAVHRARVLPARPPGPDDAARSRSTTR